MIYKSIRVDEYGKAVVCPNCDNEELSLGDYCMICGNDIINRCAETPNAQRPHVRSKSCGATLPGNARYCPKCGNESTYYQRGWLRDWRSENTRRAIENINMAVDFNDLQEERSSV